MPEFYITEDFTTPIECLSDALGSINGLYEENRIEDKENAKLEAQIWLKKVMEGVW